MLDPGRLLSIAWRWAPRLPETLVRAVLALAADLVWVRRGKGVRRLESNLARVRPGLSRWGLRRLSHAGMRSYFRYYAEVLIQPGLSGDKADARVRAVNDGWARERFAAGESVVAALGHLGNWDLAGLWACRDLAPVTTVAERLEPEQVFLDFLAVREGAGMRILPLGKGEGSQAFRGLTKDVRAGGRLIPLLADRDLSRHGVEVTLFGEKARVAAGPAALTATGQAPLCTISITYERLRGERRRRAGAPWGILLELSDPIVVDEAITGRDRVAAVTQAWVDSLAATIERAPQDWHMLQRVFVTDLDPARDAAETGGAA
ncbi:MAG: phosphatidylinositol mannoside acyltransferase [Micrococcales bacterium]|nr:phosphatidylinositol mannoside acyltransferase [Micrococcales bacterium]